MKTETLIKSAISAFLALTATHAISASAQESAPTERCYGVVKAAMNDCNTASSSCAGSSTKDGQPDAFVLMPKGLCEKLVGGKLKL
jgi:uncharacterized membrane protein